MDYITVLANHWEKSSEKFPGYAAQGMLWRPLQTHQVNDWVGFSPNTPINEGVTKFVEWYLNYYGNSN